MLSAGCPSGNQRAYETALKSRLLRDSKIQDGVLLVLKAGNKTNGVVSRENNDPIPLS